VPEVVAVASDSGMMGGKVSHEYMLLTPVGEDTIVLCHDCDYRANMEAAPCIVHGEAGEVADMIKKNMFQGHTFDLEVYVKELGDVAWYLALGCEVAGIDLETVMEANIEKLRERYPDGFDPERSRNREE
jgi:NTP pyrophosphatase (non-canonical NTP hydrolase)